MSYAMDTQGYKSNMILFPTKRKHRINLITYKLINVGKCTTIELDQLNPAKFCFPFDLRFVFLKLEDNIEPLTNSGKISFIHINPQLSAIFL